MMPGAARARVVTPRAGTAPVHFRKYPRERSLRERDGGDVTDMVTSVKRIVSGKETRLGSRPRAASTDFPSPLTPKGRFSGIALQNLSDFAAEPGFCVLVRRPRYELRAADGVTCCCRPARPHR